MSRPTLDGIRQASTGAFDKAKLMVGLKAAEEEETAPQSKAATFVAEAADLICPELTFQQRVIGFASCFALGCECFKTMRSLSFDWKLTPVQTCLRQHQT
jgi:hypothetical protein